MKRDRIKAIVQEEYGPPEMLQRNEVAKPAPKDNEVLVKVYATTATAAGFRSRRFTVPLSFLPARITLGFRKPILGVELAGEFESVGRDVKRFKKGDQVFAATLISYGTHAEYKCLPENAAISIKPSNLTYEETAALPIGHVQYCTIFESKHPELTKVLVQGASGSVGTYAIELAK